MSQCCVLELYGKEGEAFKPLLRYGLEKVDFERFFQDCCGAGLHRGALSPQAGWKPTLGISTNGKERGFDIRIDGEDGGRFAKSYPLSALEPLALRLKQELQRRELIAARERVYFRLEPGDSPPTEETWRRWELPGPLVGRPDGEVTTGDEMAIRIAPEVLPAAMAHARSSRDEVGGFLLGRLSRAGGLVLELEAALPSHHTEATATSLRLTSAAWMDARRQLKTRGRDEHIVGWFHSHPFARDRLEGARRNLFLSADDLFLQEAFFPHFWSVAVVVTPYYEAGEEPVALFGWRDGAVSCRALCSFAEETEDSCPIQAN